MSFILGGTPSYTRHLHYLLILPITLGIAGFVGCGGDDSQNLVPVSGKVTYEDGSLIEAEQITITFFPESPGDKPLPNARGAMAIVDVKDGTFDSAMTRVSGDGMLVGSYQVVVRADDANSQLLDGFPQKYAERATTPIKVHTDDSPFHFRIAKSN